MLLIIFTLLFAFRILGTPSCEKPFWAARQKIRFVPIGLVKKTLTLVFTERFAYFVKMQKQEV